MEGAQDLRKRKAALRARMRTLRNTIPADERIRLAREIEGNLFSLPEIDEAGAILLFDSFGSEVPTTKIVQRLLDAGRRVLLPYLEGRVMEAAELLPGDSLTATTYGPREPSNRVPIDPAAIDAVVAPGLAFDREGYRLGYGGGHYDRYLSGLPPETPRVGIGFDLQLVPSVPHGPGDQTLDFVVTERQIIECEPRRDAG